MMKKTLLSFFIILSFTCFAQDKPLKADNTEPKTDTTHIQEPVVFTKDDIEGFITFMRAVLTNPDGTEDSKTFAILFRRLNELYQSKQKSNK